MTYRPAHALDIGYALMGVKTVRRRSGVHWWATETPQGSATVAFRAGNGMVRADGWGAGTDWAFTQLPSLLGAGDTAADEFHTEHPLLKSLTSRFEGLRIGATGRWYEALATNAIGQRVVTADAHASRDQLSRRYGTPAVVGPTNAFPTPEAMLRLTDHEFHRLGIERSRARVLRVAAKYADRLERLNGMPGHEATDWLQRLPGSGPGPRG